MKKKKNDTTFWAQFFFLFPDDWLGEPKLETKSILSIHALIYKHPRIEINITIYRFVQLLTMRRENLSSSSTRWMRLQNVRGYSFPQQEKKFLALSIAGCLRAKTHLREAANMS